MSPSCSHMVQRFPHKHTETQSREKEDGSMELAWAAATSGNGSSHWLLLWCLGVICFVLSLWSTCKFRSFTFPRPFETPALSICIWSCITKLMWKSGFCAAETPLCLPAFIFNGDVVYGNCLLLPSTSCKLPSALSRPVVYTCVYAHCCEVQWHVLGKIMSKPSRPAKPVMSPSVLAFSAENVSNYTTVFICTTIINFLDEDAVSLPSTVPLRPCSMHIWWHISVPAR